jgi:alanine racemase
VLNSAAQVLRWRETGRPCDVMVDTGIHRLGLTPDEVRAGVLDGLEIETLHSHLACADEDVAANARQLALFEEVSRVVPAKRRSLANSAGICLGGEYAFDLTRPGLALYGGIPRAEAAGRIGQVVRIEAQVIQRRRVPAGGSVGYNATWTADGDSELAILPVVGRVSMDLTAVRVDATPQLCEGHWVEIDFDLPRAARQSGLSQYELLTSLGSRHERVWS